MRKTDQHNGLDIIAPHRTGVAVQNRIELDLTDATHRGTGRGAGMDGVPNGGRGTAGMSASGEGGDAGLSGTAIGPPGAIFQPDQRAGDGSVTLTFTPA